MIKIKKLYERKISSEEARDSFILVTENRTHLFPSVNEPFKLIINDGEYEIKMVVVDCFCRGPKKPHVHYRLDFKPLVKHYRLRFGQSIIIEKLGDNLYKLDQK